MGSSLRGVSVGRVDSGGVSAQRAAMSPTSAPSRADGPGRRAGVRSRRGDGAGCRTPSTSTNTPRSALCGSRAASGKFSTGVTQASVPSKFAAHSAIVLVAIRVLDQCAQLRPVRFVVPVGPRVGVGAQTGEEGSVEVRFERADRHEPPVGATVGVVERRAVVDVVGSGLVGEQAGGAQALHPAVSSAAPSTMDTSTTCPRPERAGLEQGADDAERTESAATGVVAEVVHRRTGRSPGCPRVCRTPDWAT